MADAGDAKPTPAATQDASAGLRPAEQETNLVKNPLGDSSSEAPTTESKDTKPTTYTEAATNAATSAASTASAAASNVFAMFGGGVKKERKPEEDEDAKDEPSGSSKAQKKEDDDEVRYPPHREWETESLTEVALHRRKRTKRKQTSNSNLSTV